MSGWGFRFGNSQQGNCTPGAAVGPAADWPPLRAKGGLFFQRGDVHSERFQRKLRDGGIILQRGLGGEPGLR